MTRSHSNSLAKDIAIAKTASESAYFCDLCKTWNVSETASCFDVSLRVRLGCPLGVCSTVLISGALKKSVKCGYSNSSQLA